MNICVFGASSNAIDPAYLAAGERLGEEMAKRGHGLVFGGGASGLMGAVARGMTRGGGETIVGVAPQFFNVDGVLYEHCTEFIYTDTMRERKQIMDDRSDAVIMTPGGIGTFEEFFEILTLKQLGRHSRPIAVFNIGGYFDELLAMMEKAEEQQFMKNATLTLYDCFTDEKALLDFIEQHRGRLVSVEETKNI